MASRTTYTITESSHQLTSSGANTVTNSDQACGTNSTNASYVGSRFTNIAVAQGATINKAVLRWSKSSGPSSSSATATMRGNDADNAAALAASNNFLSGLTLTTANVATFIGYTPEAYYEFDVTSIIQEIVDRGGWTSGNAITLVLTGFNFGTIFSVINRASWELTIAESATDTGWLNPTADAGDWALPTRAYQDGTGDGGNATTENQTTAAHRFSGFDFSSVPSGATILGLECLVDAWINRSSSNSQLSLAISTDSGTSYSSPILSEKLTTSQSRFFFGLGANWDVTVSQSDLGSTLYVRVTNVFDDSANDGRFDWVAVRVLYAVAGGPTFDPAIARRRVLLTL